MRILFCFYCFLFTIFLFPSNVCSRTQTIDYDAIFYGNSQFNTKMSWCGDKNIYADGSKTLIIRNSILGTHLEIDIAEANNHYYPGNVIGDIVLRRGGIGNRFVITN